MSSSTIESVDLSWDPVEPAQAGYAVASGYRVTYEPQDSPQDPIVVTDLLAPSVSVVEGFVCHSNNLIGNWYQLCLCTIAKILNVPSSKSKI